MPLEEVALDAIDYNPYRMGLLKDNPLDDDRVQWLIAYYTSHTAFPGMPVARKVGNRVQLAYGHHIIAAARALDLKTMQVEIRELNEPEMLGLMPTESGPHVKPDMILCIQSWMLARNLAQPGEAQQPTEIARNFGWTRPDPRRPGQERLSDLAAACNAAAEVLVAPGGNKPVLAKLHEFAGKSVHGVKAHAEVCRTRKGHWGFGYNGFVPENKRGIRRRRSDTIDVDAPLKHSGERPFRFSKRPIIGVLVHYADALVRDIDRQLHNDNYYDNFGQHIADLVKSHHFLESEAELEQVAKVVEALNRLIARAADWKDQLSDKPKRREPRQKLSTMPEPRQKLSAKRE